MRFIFTLIFFLLTHANLSIANPFEIDFPQKRKVTNEDLVHIQQQFPHIRSKISSLIEDLYNRECIGRGYTDLGDFNGRCSKGVGQILIDPEKGWYPIKKLVRIGQGGSRCIVCCAPFNGKYPYYIKSLIQGLKEQGFNGYFFYLIGGWPNPTGREIKYTAVPYSFKIFAMLEAHKLGFNNILWIDAACYPIRDINPLFDVIATQGALLNYFLTPPDAWRFIFPSTRRLLKKLTGTDVLRANYINTILFGMKMDTPEAKKLIKTYYHFADLGTPFLSCFPEEWVLAAIIGQKQFKHWTTHHIPNLIVGSLTNADDSPEEFEVGRQRGGYFYQRKER